MEFGIPSGCELVESASAERLWEVQLRVPRSPEMRLLLVLAASRPQVAPGADPLLPGPAPNERPQRDQKRRKQHMGR